MRTTEHFCGTFSVFGQQSMYLKYGRIFQKHPVYMQYGYCLFFTIYGSVHLKCIPIYIQQDATLHSLFISGNCSLCFGWYLHPSSGAHITVSTASGICHTVTATCRYRGGFGMIAADSSNGVTNTRCCRYSYMCC